MLQSDLKKKILCHEEHTKGSNVNDFFQTD